MPPFSGSPDHGQHFLRAGGTKLPDLNEARRFLAVIDPDPVTEFGFRTFADRGEAPSILAYGTLDRGVRQSSNPAKHGQPCKPSSLMAFVQTLIGGVFAVINRLDGHGQRDQNVTGIRALFADCDTAQAVERLLMFIHATGLVPTMIVASGGLLPDGREKLHAYWRVTGCAVPQFTPAHRLLIGRIASDPSVSNPSRVMRLPGFWHLKSEPRMTRILEITDAVYDFAGFIARATTFPPVPGFNASMPRSRNTASTIGQPEAAAFLRHYLDHLHHGMITPGVQGAIAQAEHGIRHNLLRAITARLVAGGWPDADIRALVLPAAAAAWADVHPDELAARLDRIITWVRARETSKLAAMPSRVIKGAWA
jgi:hypothetical protein